MLQLLLLLILTAPLLLLLLKGAKKPSSVKSPSGFPRSYPLVGSCFAIAKASSQNRHTQWTSDLLRASPTATIVLRRQLGAYTVFTADPANVERVLKTHFHNYNKGGRFRDTLRDFLGSGIFNADGPTWKLQRSISSHEFNTRSLRKFVETVVEDEINTRLVPLLRSRSETKSEIDLQDVLQRFAFDNVCKIAFGYDPACLSPDRIQNRDPKSSFFASAFEDCVRISSQRFRSLIPGFWRLKRVLDIGSERRLRIAIAEVRDFARIVVREKKKELEIGRGSALESVDLLSRFLSSGHSDETFVADIVISFILAGRDTTSAALTWFFWLVARNPAAEAEILAEIGQKSDATAFEEAKHEMPYTHAALCESMRLYPPVPIDSKEAQNDDIWDDGTIVKKGTRVTYHPYAMGRLEALWGPDWAQYRPQRWLKKEEDGRWSFVGFDPYKYPVFQAGPRICLGKEMAFLQMKRIVSSVLSRFRVVPVQNDGVEPVFLSYLTSKMKGGFRVLVEERSSGHVS